MSTQRADVVRAILEGTAYGLNHNLEEMRNLGLVPPVLRIVGGGSRGKTWNQIKADVTGLPVEVPTETIGAPVGSALVAAVGAGLIDDLAQGVRSRYHARDQVLPDKARHKQYQGYYELYKELYPALIGTFRRLAQLRHAEG
jgi:xylulokinase